VGKDCACHKNSEPKAVNGFISAVLNGVAATDTVKTFQGNEIDNFLYTALVDAARDFPAADKMRVFGSASLVATGELRELLDKGVFSLCSGNDRTRNCRRYPEYSARYNGRGGRHCHALRVNWAGSWTTRLRTVLKTEARLSTRRFASILCCR
jgi:hypothetical protein